MRFSGNGCKPCRSSRKKCSGERPACSRCVRSGKTCHGYSDAYSILHAEDLYASRERKRPRGPRRRVEPVMTVMSSLPRDIHSEALAYFMLYHLEPASNRSGDQSAWTLSIKQALFSTRISMPALSPAIASLSLAIFSKTKCQSLAAEQASLNYEISLHALQKVLPSIETAEIDTCLMTIHFLARYEDSVHSPFSNPENPHLRNRPHLDGIKATLEYWLNSSTDTKAASCVIMQARRMLRKAALLGQFDMPDWLQCGALFGEHGPELELDRLLIRLINLRKSICSIIEKPLDSTLEIPSLEALDADALAIDKALLDWIQRFLESSSDPLQQLGHLSMHSEISMFCPGADDHQRYTKPAIIANCYGHRILANHWRALILELMETHASSPLTCERQLGCLYDLNHLAGDLASTIPVVFDSLTTFGDLGSDNPNSHQHQELMPYIAESVALPLVIASTSNYLDVGNRELFRRQLAYIGRRTGYGIMEYVASCPDIKL